ncbi:hypothetical protein [uncultured Clostridium sp.]|jgi:ferritin-like protein|uniref:hypothetical protein n=1 Tax=uncultured Clostridium sp. TaxID=59620 RepID=UPI0026034008|nr:hypothetical protein [uncultured Clostridium sp.]MCI9064215.1 hypothetical protein [Clostridia bacterium]
MSKQNVRLRLKDMYAIKHALQVQIRIKKGKVDDLENTCMDIHDLKTYELEVNKLKNDIQHEEWLLQSMTNEIEEFKINNSIK